MGNCLSTSGDKSPSIRTVKYEKKPSTLCSVNTLTRRKITRRLENSQRCLNENWLGNLGRSSPEVVDSYIARLLKAGVTRTQALGRLCLKDSEVAQICITAIDILKKEPNLIEVNPPFKVVGDIHGQYIDLLRIFESSGFPSDTNYLFLGDYVDRGRQSLETILLLLCFKIKYPEKIYLLRGNHECANTSYDYGFEDECSRRLKHNLWGLFIQVFNILPIAGLIGGKIFCVHGGISPCIFNLREDINRVKRPITNARHGQVADFLWSDPDADQVSPLEANPRGISFTFNEKALDEFMDRLGLELICRSHQPVEYGYEFFDGRRLVTIFSAPNYLGKLGNWGAVMCVAKDLDCTFEIYE